MIKLEIARDQIGKVRIEVRVCINHKEWFVQEISLINYNIWKLNY